MDLRSNREGSQIDSTICTGKSWIFVVVVNTGRPCFFLRYPVNRMFDQDKERKSHRDSRLRTRDSRVAVSLQNLEGLVYDIRRPCLAYAMTNNHPVNPSVLPIHYACLIDIPQLLGAPSFHDHQTSKTPLHPAFRPMW